MISNSEFNQKLLQEIEKQLPKKGQQLNFLMEEMSLGKESAYRRLRGDVPFSFTEACIISKRLGLSLDDITMAIYKTKKHSFLLHVPPPENTPEDYVYYYMQTYDIYETLLNRWMSDPSLTIYTASNIVPQALMFPYPYLSKFRAFAWRYQMHHGIVPTNFSSINIPNELIAKQQILAQRIKQFPDITFVVSRHVFSTLIKMIKYFFNLNLLTREEVLTIKDELLDLLSRAEYTATHEKTDHNGKALIYIANIDFDSNYTYVSGQDYERAFIELYFLNTISTSDSKICKAQKDWIDSLKKYSTLISMSGNIERIAFFKKQQDLINSLNDEMYPETNIIST